MSPKERQIAELLVYAKENYPLIAPMLNSRLHLVKTKYGGVILIAIAACELLTVVLG